jgi:hypothetical protein
MNDIRIVRLKNGEDIIGSFCNVDGKIQLVEPMIVSVIQRGNESGLVMSHWLPVQLIKKNEIILNNDDILTTFEPNDEFSEYYSNTVEKISMLLQAKRIAANMTDEEIDEVMKAIESGNGETIH